MVGRRQKIKYEIVDHEEENPEKEPAKCKLISTASAWAILSSSLLIATYFVPSIGLTFYQRWLLQRYHFPLIVVLIHMIIKFLLAVVIRLILAYKYGRPRLMVGWKEYLMGVAPTGVFSGIDIGFSNWGLELNFITLYSMTKSTVIIFILIFSILFKLEKKSWSLCVIVVMISTGLFLFTYKSPEFNLFGFVLLLIASVCSGLRWTCAQLILQKSKMGMKNPIDMIFHMQPWMIISLLPLAIFLEGGKFLENIEELHKMWLLVLLGALIAFFMEITEVLVVTYTSSLTLSVAGIFKEILIVTLAVAFNGDTMTFINSIGLVICMGGIICHVVHKIKTTPIQNISRPYEFEQDHHELGRSLMDNSVDQINLTSESDSEHSDSQELFNILNSHDR